MNDVTFYRIIFIFIYRVSSGWTSRRVCINMCSSRCTIYNITFYEYERVQALCLQKKNPLLRNYYQTLRSSFRVKYFHTFNVFFFFLLDTTLKFKSIECYFFGDKSSKKKKQKRQKRAINWIITVPIYIFVFTDFQNIINNNAELI